MEMENVCLDRACEYQYYGPHETHNIDADPSTIKVVVSLYKTDLEILKYDRGHRCIQCSRLLIPTDGDHSFCDDCWDEIMVHDFFPDEDNEEKCDRCGERKEYKDHKPSTAQHGEGRD